MAQVCGHMWNCCFLLKGSEECKEEISFAWLPPLLLDAAHLGGELCLSKASYRSAVVGVFIHRTLRKAGT